MKPNRIKGFLKFLFRQNRIKHLCTVNVKIKKNSEEMQKKLYCGHDAMETEEIKFKRWAKLYKKNEGMKRQSVTESKG